MFEVSVNGKLKLEDAIVFLDKDGVTLTYNDRRIPSIGERYNSELKFYSEDEFILKKCLEWIKKAKVERDGFNKFFALWVSYNAFYNLYARKKEESIRNCVRYRYRNARELCKIIETQNLLDLEERKTLIQKCLLRIRELLNETYHVYLGTDRNRRDVKRDLEERIKEFEKDNNNETIVKETFETLLKFLYGIRNNLFHGEKRLSDARQNELLNYAYEILLPILSLMLIKYCLTSLDANNRQIWSSG